MSLFKGEPGFPPVGFPLVVFPTALSRKVLKREPSAPYRPGDPIPLVDLDAVRTGRGRVRATARRSATGVEPSRINREFHY
ncbi:pyruvate carboxylase [Burkholderia lata]|uniref:Pyruvate carboxylase n=1 Tax=Burkholderia lata (strain ATCC 17760 / DSM 23089 / LMG 22485 / NCIMB 9086 / R18194 / 383) TaxID=482957 RepID=A0A6P2TGN1_BURL3|nr:pyruvate carboxylase [Burkholderia lata]